MKKGGQRRVLGRFSGCCFGASPTLQLIATLENEVRDTVWQVSDIACVPVFRCIVMSGGGDTGVRTHEKGGAKKGPVKVLRVSALGHRPLLILTPPS